MNATKQNTTFPAGFTWGAASSAFQIEGATGADGRGPTVWDEFCKVPGAIWQGQNADRACDHYHHWAEDVRLMRQIGLHAYRFSISWSRVLPDGTGRVNEVGLGFYDRLVDGLLAAGIQPWATLFHWDFPLALHRRGGWKSRDSAQWFAEYASVVADRLGDRVTHWMTHNEPQCFIGGGPSGLRLAPGEEVPLSDRLLMIHNALRGHGRAVVALRARTRNTPQVGWAMVGVTPTPADDRPESLRAAQQYAWGVPNRDLWNNAWYADPVILGGYPEEGLRVYGEAVPKSEPGDFDEMRQPLDFYGLNIYHGIPVTAGDDGTPRLVDRQAGYAKTAFDWPMEPDSLYWGSRFHYERYGIPIVITENGLSSMDWVSLDGRVHDVQRIDFMRRYLLALRRGIAETIDIRGYLHWSILDNFEWLDGYKQRFGLIHVDYATQARVLKDSALWYREVIETNGASLADTPFDLLDSARVPTATKA